MPAGKLELFRGIPSQEEAKEQVQPHKDSRHLTPKPTPAVVPSVPTVTQVSLGEGWDLPPRGHLEWGFDFPPIQRGYHPMRPGPWSVATLVSRSGVDLEEGTPHPSHTNNPLLPISRASGMCSFTCSFIHSIFAKQQTLKIFVQGRDVVMGKSKSRSLPSSDL